MFSTKSRRCSKSGVWAVVIHGVAVLIPRDFAVQMTWLPEKVCLYRVCAYMRCGYNPVRLYLYLQNSNLHW